MIKILFKKEESLTDAKKKIDIRDIDELLREKKESHQYDTDQYFKVQK